MELDEVSEKYPVLSRICQIIKERDKINDLFPPQEEAISEGCFDGKSLVLSIPTSGGKTLIAELAAMKTILEKKKKVVYTCPLRSLAMEKYDEFREKYSGLGIKIALSIGDYDSSDQWLENYDCIITSYEKLDSLIRHNSSWVYETSLFIIDEIHTLDDVSRGPTLEIVITRMREICPNAQVLALSATIPNAKELSDWLNAKLILSDWRPVPLHEGVLFRDEIFFKNKKRKIEEKGNPDIALAENAVKIGKQAIIFVGSRRSAEATAEKLGKEIKKFLKEEERERLNETARRVLSAVETPTKQCKRLAGCISDGTAFHHAGLVNEQRRIIEKAYREGIIKVIASTPSLGAGVNLPNYRSICRDLKRYNDLGVEWIPVREYKQWAGRSGRVKYDKEGEAILIARYEDEIRELWDKYIDGKPEKIYSRLSVEPILRMHILSLIATDVTRSINSLNEFFKKTFFFHQFKSTKGIEEKIGKILAILEKWEFIRIEFNELSATRLGKRVSELYIDPLTAHSFVEFLKAKKGKPISFLYMASDTVEMAPLLRVRVREERRLEEEFEKNKEYLFSQKELNYDTLQILKTALMFDAWINEENEEKLLEKFGIPPGELRGRIERARWLLYSMEEIGRVLGTRVGEVRKLRKMVGYGVKEELLPLVALRGIGRIRGRRLFDYGIKSISDIGKAKEEEIAKLIGAKVARDIKEALSS